MVSRDSGLLATLTAGVLFGLAIPLIKLGLDRGVPPLSFAALRFWVASILILVLLKHRGWVDRSLFSSKQMWAVGFLNALGYIFQFQGQLFTSGSEAALIIGTAALMIPLMSWFKRQETFRASKASGVVTGFAGVALLVVGEPVEPSNVNAQSHLIGDVLLLATAVTIALVFIYSKSLAVERGDRAVTGGMILTTSVLLLPFVPFGQNIETLSDVGSWVIIIFLAVFGTMGAYYFFSRGLERVSPIISSIILPTEVVVSVVLSVLLFNESFTVLSGIGALLTVAGVGLVSLTK